MIEDKMLRQFKKNNLPHQWLHSFLSNLPKEYMPLIFVVSCFAAIYLINNILPLINMAKWHYENPNTVPPFDPVGIDFRGGLYWPAKALIKDINMYPDPDPTKAISIYPPLTDILALPYLLVSENKAYIIHVFLLFVTNIYCLVISTLIAKDYFIKGIVTDAKLAFSMLFSIFLLIFYNLVSGYPFLFSIERGNIDIFAMAFCLSSLWVFLKHPNKIWWQVLLLSVAVHIKIYPIVLFAVLFYKHRFKMILPSAVINVLFLFSLGPANAIGFLRAITFFTDNPIIWIGDHAAYSFGGAFVAFVPALTEYLPTIRFIFTCLPILIWIIAWIFIFKMKSIEKGAILAFMVTVPIMEVLPSRSNDYKLVISACTHLLLVLLVLIRMTKQQSVWNYLQLVVITISLFFIGRSFALIDDTYRILQNKYPWILILQVLMVINIYQYNKQVVAQKVTAQETESLSTEEEIEYKEADLRPA